MAFMDGPDKYRDMNDFERPLDQMSVHIIDIDRCSTMLQQLCNAVVAVRDSLRSEKFILFCASCRDVHMLICSPLICSQTQLIEYSEYRRFSFYYRTTFTKQRIQSLYSINTLPTPNSTPQPSLHPTPLHEPADFSVSKPNRIEY